MSFQTLPAELKKTILDFMASGRPYRVIEEVVRLEDIFKLTPGTLTDFFRLEKLLMDQSSSINQWRDVVSTLDQLIPQTPVRYMVAGGFMAHELGRTTEHGDVDVFISIPFNSPVPDVPGLVEHLHYELGGPHRYFRVYSMENSPFQFIVNYGDDDDSNISDLAASILYDFDMQTCQCAMLSNGKTVVIDSCMAFLPKEDINLYRIQKYRERLASHTPMCTNFCSQHWEFPY